MDTPLDRPTGPGRWLMGAKLMAPAAQAQQVLRPAVVDPVCSTPGSKLVLFRAPAGFGKTTAMLQCRERMQTAGIDTAWLTLDRADNDASRFLAGIEAAVATLSEDADPDGADGDLGASRSLGDIALRAIARLAEHPAPFALFLDELEAIQEPGVLGLLREIVDHLPPQGRLVIGSRSLPDLRLGRLRARGQLLEIDATRLRFTLHETVEFFTLRRGNPLDAEAVAQLHRKTEGWVAALWLASVALERSASPAEFIERFSGTDRAIADYLAEDVLARQTPQVRAFLLRTSVLRHLEAPLCDALVPGADSRAILEELETADVLLVPLGTPGAAWRYHSLFAKFLQDRLARESPEAASRLHSAASDWYRRQGRPVPAIDHAIEGGDATGALALLSVHGQALLAQGRMRLLDRWFSALPEGALRDHRELQLVRMWATAFTRGPRDAMDQLQRSGLVSSRDPTIAPHVRALQPCLLAMMDRYEEAHPVGRQSLEQLPSAVAFADSLLSNAMATIVSVMGEPEEARRLIDAARRGQGSSVSEFNTMYSEAAEGIIDLQEARLRQATARFRLAVTATPHGSYTHTNGNAWAGVPYAVALYETGQLDKAAHLLQVYVPLARDVGLPDLVILGYRTLERIAFSRGDVDQALQLLTELEYVGHKSGLPRVVASARLERARMLTLQGHFRSAREELERAEDPELWRRVGRLRFLANDLDYLEIGRLRWELHAGDARAAARRLAAAAAAAAADSRHRRALKLRLMYAAALHRGGDPGSAVTTLSGALEMASTEGFVRIALDEGDILRPVVHALASAVRNGDRSRTEPVFADYVHGLAAAFGPSDTPSSGRTRGAPQVLLEPMTRKEIRVLQLLAEGYSNGAMAEKLFVSDSTIRTHLRNINTKLDVHSRTQAVAAARRLGLIP